MDQMNVGVLICIVKGKTYMHYTGIVNVDPESKFLLFC